MEKRFRVVPRGIGLVIGCCTFPTWNGYPGLLREPRHRQRGGRQAASGRDPAARDHREDRARGAGRGGLRSERRHAGRARRRRRRRAEARAAARGQAHRLHRQRRERQLARGATRARRRCSPRRPASTRSSSTRPTTSRASRATSRSRCRSTPGQMCTAPQNIYVPAGRHRHRGRASARSTRSPAASPTACSKLLGDPARAVEILGAVQNDGVLQRLEAARSLGTDRARHADDRASAVSARRAIRTPLIVKLDAADRDKYLDEWFGPIAFVIATRDTDAEPRDRARRGAGARRADAVRVLDERGRDRRRRSTSPRTPASRCRST